MLSVLQGKLCESVERSDTGPPIHVNNHTRFDGPSAPRPIKPEDFDEDAMQSLTDVVPESDGHSQAIAIPKSSITRNRPRRDQLSSSDDEVAPIAPRLLSRPTPDRREVWLHVYDLGPVTSRLNELVLRGANLGAFHAGVEVLSAEWSFMGFYDAWDDYELSGVVQNAPRLHPSYIFRESIFMGVSAHSERDIEAIILEMCERWRANSYHWVSRNCIDFAEEFSGAVGASHPFPAWLRGAIDLGKTPAVFAVADLGWTWFKWLSARQAAQELNALHAEEARAAEEAKKFTDKSIANKPIPSSIVERRREAPAMHRGREESLAELADAQAQLAHDLERLRLAKARLQSALSTQSDI